MKPREITTADLAFWRRARERTTRCDAGPMRGDHIGAENIEVVRHAWIDDDGSHFVFRVPFVTDDRDSTAPVSTSTTWLTIYGSFFPPVDLVVTTPHDQGEQAEPDEDDRHVVVFERVRGTTNYRIVHSVACRRSGQLEAGCPWERAIDAYVTEIVDGGDQVREGRYLAVLQPPDDRLLLVDRPVDDADRVRRFVMRNGESGISEDRAREILVEQGYPISAAAIDRALEGARLVTDEPETETER